MRTILALSIVTLLSASMASIAATIEYQYPNLTIVATEEPLDAVLKSLGKEMRIYIIVPTGLHPVVNCDIQHQSIKQAFKILLGDMSYSLEWEEKTGKLVGLTILGGGGSAVTGALDSISHTATVEQAAPVPVATRGNQAAGVPATEISHDAPTADHDTAMADNEAWMAEEREAHEEKMMEEVARHEAETAAYLEEQGLQPPQ